MRWGGKSTSWVGNKKVSWDAQHPQNTSDVAVHLCNPSAGGTETSRPRVSLASQVETVSSRFSERPVLGKECVNRRHLRTMSHAHMQKQIHPSYSFTLNKQIML